VIIILLTLVGSFAIAWDKTKGTQQRLDRAVGLMASGKFEESLKLYKRVVFWWSSSKLAWTGKGLCELNLGLFEDALASFNENLKINPEDVHSLQGKSWGLEGIGRYDEALACYIEIDRLRPGVLDAKRQIQRLKGISGRSE